MSQSFIVEQFTYQKRMNMTIDSTVFNGISTSTLCQAQVETY